MEQETTLTREDVLEALADGHTVWKPEYAKRICDFCKVPFAEKSLVRKFKSDPPGTFKGLTMIPGQENTEGVDGLTLSGYVARELGVYGKAGEYFGRGRQARAYAEQVAKVI